MTVVTDYTALLSGLSWSGMEVANRPIFLTYSFLTASPAAHANPLVMGDAASTFQAFDAADQEKAREALAAWADASGLTLLEVAPEQGTINFSWYDFTGTPWDDSDGFAFLPFGDWNGFSDPYFIDQMPTGSVGGNIFLDINAAVGGLPDFQLLLREIGHALGFKNPAEAYGDHDETLDPALDTIANTVLSDNGAGATALGPLDLDAVTHLYGAADSDGTQVASWSWDAALSRLTQLGFNTAEVIQGIAAEDVINGRDGADTILGLDSADTLNGGAGDDLVIGGSGDDRIAGGLGADILLGGFGNDRYVVDDSGDLALEAPDEGVDVVVASASFELWDNVENLVLTGTAGLSGFGNDQANRIAGNAGDNLLAGFGGDDNITGGAGFDTLVGGVGRDRLTGGAYTDLFFYLSPDEGGDRIMDFVAGEDLIAITTAGFGNLLPGALPEESFVAHATNRTTAASGTAQFIYNTASGLLLFDVDGQGGAAAAKIAVLAGAPVIGLDDILLL